MPGRARCTLDVRSLDPDALARAVAEILAVGRRSAAENRCGLRTVETKRMPPAIVEPEILAILAAAARAEGLEAPRLPSRAAHDGMNLALAGVPIGMVFVRSRGGVSHAPAERSTDEDRLAGARVLARAALEVATRLERTGALAAVPSASAGEGDP